MKNLYLIGGPMGVGKTAVSRELKNILADSVFLDGDNLWDMHPFTVNDATKKCVISNIVACLCNFLACPQFKNIIFCWVMHEQYIIDEIAAGLDLSDARLVNVSLICSPRTLEERFGSDVRRGVRKREAMQSALNYLPKYASLSTAKIVTDGLAPDEIARKIADL